jgi:rod shape-determining protein MreB
LDAGLLLSSSSLPIRLRGWGRPLSLSTCLAEDDTGRVLAYGEKAEVMQGRAPAGVSLSRPISEGRITDLDGSKFLLEKVLTGSKHRVLMGPRVVIGVASHLTALERKTVEEVSKAAGARRVSLVDVCLLGILGAERDPFSSGELIVDLGSGHGEVALVSRGSILQVRTIQAAGQRMDDAIVQMVMQRHGLKISPRQAERLKLAIGGARAQDRAGEAATVAGCHAVSGLPSSVEVAAEEVSEALAPVLTEIAKEVRQVLKDAPPQLVSDVASHKALLVGGGANLPGLPEYLEAITHLAFEVPERPEKAAQRGLDRVLGEPGVRRRLLSEGKALLAPTSRGRLTEKLIGLAACAMLLFASYFPAEKTDSLKPLTSISDSFAPMWASLRAPFEPTAEAQTLQAENHEKDRRLRQLAEENKTLRKMNGKKAKAPAWASGPSLSARVVARAAQSWNDQIVIDAGREQGVAAGMTAVSNKGLVGRVQSVSRKSARVSLISTPSSEMGGKVQRTKSAGVIRIGQDGAMEIHFLDPDDGIKAGDLVVTSGLDGVYPAGIPVGKVERVFRPDNEVYVAARLKPLPDLNSLEAVLLVGGQQV